MFLFSNYRESKSWPIKVDENGEIFYLELCDETHPSVEVTCSCSVCDCANDDTGYGTDSECHSIRSGLSTKSCNQNCHAAYSSRNSVRIQNPTNTNHCSGLGCMEEKNTSCDSCSINRMKEVAFKLTLNGYRLNGSKHGKNRVRTKSDVKVFCQHVLGIVPGYFKENKLDRRIRIDGLVIDGTAIQYQYVLRIGK